MVVEYSERTPAIAANDKQNFAIQNSYCSPSVLVITFDFSGVYLDAFAVCFHLQRDVGMEKQACGCEEHPTTAKIMKVCFRLCSVFSPAKRCGNGETGMWV